ncbi:hypothetical protein ACE2AJ_09475 [Aquihabitans daechungensis]|uniref:hypothetical protein n=1 Tax=Aquihabitans daechungensis TaxID=1052257 RepID=UPI003BA13C7A
MTLSAHDEITFRCTGGNVVVADATTTYAPAPAVTCAALTLVTVSGDGDNQDVDGSGLDAAAFVAKPKLSVGLGQGFDSVIETQNADTIDLGGGSDDLFLRRGLAANTSLEMGDGALDHAYLASTDGHDESVVTSTGANTTLTHKTPSLATFTWLVKNVEYIDVDGGKGSDQLNAAPVAASSTLQLVDLDGEDGSDSLLGGDRPMRLNGGPGPNTIETALGADEIETEAETDVIDGLSDAADDIVRDDDSLRFGGRAITGFGNSGGSPPTRSPPARWTTTSPSGCGRRAVAGPP